MCGNMGLEIIPDSIKEEVKELDSKEENPMQKLIDSGFIPFHYDLPTEMQDTDGDTKRDLRNKRIQFGKKMKRLGLPLSQSVFLIHKDNAEEVLNKTETIYSDLDSEQKKRLKVQPITNPKELLIEYIDDKIPELNTELEELEDRLASLDREKEGYSKEKNSIRQRLYRTKEKVDVVKLRLKDLEKLDSREAKMREDKVGNLKSYARELLLDIKRNRF